jgi:hypothetical protein
LQIEHWFPATYDVPGTLAGLQTAPQGWKEEWMAKIKLPDVLFGLGSIAAIVSIGLAARSCASTPDLPRGDLFVSLGLGVVLGALAFLPRFPLHKGTAVLWVILFVGGYLILKLIPDPAGDLGASVFTLAICGVYLYERLCSARDTVSKGDGNGHIHP